MSPLPSWDILVNVIFGIIMKSVRAKRGNVMESGRKKKRGELKLKVQVNSEGKTLKAKTCFSKNCRLLW
jgi:hypothetical protein